MNKIEIETKRESTITGNNATNKLLIEDPRESIITGEQTSLTIQKRSDSTITLYMTEPQTIIIQKQKDITQTVYV